jgi:two-component system chemotaxis sensor kinase CheA
MSSVPQRVHLALGAKLSAAFLAVTLTCAVIAGILVDRNVGRTALATVEDRLSYETTMLAQMTAAALFGEVDPTDTSLDDSVRALGAAVHTELAVVANDGTVVADSGAEDPHHLGSQAASPEIVAARSAGRGTAIRNGRMFVARAIVRDGKTLGFARSAVPMSEVTSYVRGVRERMAWGSGIALIVAAVLGVLFSAQVVRPIRALSDGARRVGAGDFDHTIEVRTTDEIGELAASFNEMTVSLRRTVAMLDGRNADMRIVLDNVTQGLLTIDRACVISKERSAIVETWFGPVLEGTRFPDYIRSGDPHAADGFELQWEQVTDAVLPLALLLDQLPNRIAWGDRQFEVSYTPVLVEGEREKLDRLLVVVSDVTARVAAERAEAEQREVANVLERATRDRAAVLGFLVESEAQVREITEDGGRSPTDARRVLHTLKGNCGLYGVQRVATLCHAIETRMGEDGGDLLPDERSALRGAWSSVAGRLSALLGRASQIVLDDDEYDALLKAIGDGAPRADVARMVRDWRLERVRDRLQRSAEQARELAKRLDKGALEVEIESGGLRLPREAWSHFWAAFIHLVRNAVDHGIESVEERRLAGKPESGRIRLTARRDDRSVQIAVSDDGRGIDWSAIAAKAEAMGLAARRHEDLVAALFVDGLSSRTDVTDLSGRGVGLSALQQACRALGGAITVQSEKGVGTTFRCDIPAGGP